MWWSDSNNLPRTNNRLSVSPAAVAAGWELSGLLGRVTRTAVSIPRMIADKLAAMLRLDELASQERSYEHARLIIRFFYFHLVFLSFLMLLWTGTYAGRQNFDPVWSIAWARYVAPPVAIHAIRYFFAASVFIGPAEIALTRVPSGPRFSAR